MKLAAFNAVCPYEIGDRVTVIVPAKENDNGVMYEVKDAVITDIACTHYIRAGKVVFTYELNKSGKYAPLLSPQEAGLTV